MWEQNVNDGRLEVCSWFPSAVTVGAKNALETVQVKLNNAGVDVTLKEMSGIKRYPDENNGEVFFPLSVTMELLNHDKPLFSSCTHEVGVDTC